MKCRQKKIMMTKQANVITSFRIVRSISSAILFRTLVLLLQIKLSLLRYY